MQREQFVWEHFKFNSEQRLKGFNFFIVLSIFADGGVLAALEKSLEPRLIVLLGIFIILLSVVFLIVDQRSRNLLILAIPALKEIESTYPPSFQLFRLDSEEQGKIIRYTFAFRFLMISQLLFGAGTVLAAFKQMC